MPWGGHSSLPPKEQILTKQGATFALQDKWIPNTSATMLLLISKVSKPDNAYNGPFSECYKDVATLFIQLDMKL